MALHLSHQFDREVQRSRGISFLFKLKGHQLSAADTCTALGPIPH